jgi:AcrR family transcriptional regulator
LQDALKRLLEEKEFDKITIQDIAEAATLNRATFYAHYPDKFALLEELIRVNFLQLLECRKIRFDGSCATAFHPIVLAVCDYLAELQKSRASKQRQFEAFVEGTVIDQIRVILMDGYKKHPAEGTNNPDLIAATASWAIYGRKAMGQHSRTYTRRRIRSHCSKSGAADPGGRCRLRRNFVTLHLALILGGGGAGTNYPDNRLAALRKAVLDPYIRVA